ncbi:AAA family ATPase [Pedobacter sp. P26]|uniref:AAA family ATPase n=1 Tax=Pedobacter sp. P26 TaxID=3423956 RepID=UPI003D678822
MYIESIKIDNIRSIRHFEMKFKNPPGWHVVIGDNGAGKSTFVKAVSLALVGAVKAIYLRQDFKKWIRIGAGVEEKKKIELGILRDNRDVKYSGTKPPSNYNIGVEIIEKESRKTDNVATNTTLTTVLALESAFPKHYELAGLLVSGYFSAAFGPYRRFTGGNTEWSAVSPYPTAEAHISAFGEDVMLGECINWLKNLRTLANEPANKDRERYKTLLDDFVNFFNHGEILPHNSKLKLITSQDILFLDGNSNEVSVMELSDGYRSVLSMTFDLIRQLTIFYPNEDVFLNVRKGGPGNYFIDLPGVVIIDEIDAHLHPTWQQEIGNTLTRLFPKIQFIVTTHSPLVCRAAQKGSIWRLAAPGNDNESGEITGIERERLINGNILDAYGTEVFGENVSISEEANEKINRLAELNIKSITGEIEDSEKVELQKLKTIFPSEKQ